MELKLIRADKDIKQDAIKLIKEFWKEHNNYIQNDEETNEDYNNWTRDGHILYLIKLKEEFIGIAHMGNRGSEIDWLEDLFIMPKYQNKGYGSYVIKKLEEMVKVYSKSLYIEASARKLKAIKLYYNLGYDCLNTITIRKDFNMEDFKVIKKEKIADFTFEIKKYNK